MQTIGNFAKAGDLYTGSILTLTLCVTVTLFPVERTSEKAPDYRIQFGAAEVGAGWNRTTSDGREFISIKIDDPALPYPIYAGLYRGDDPDYLTLVWSRPEGK